MAGSPDLFANLREKLSNAVVQRVVGVLSTNRVDERCGPSRTERVPLEQTISTLLEPNRHRVPRLSDIVEEKREFG